MSICSKCSTSYGTDTVHFCESVSGREPAFKYEPQVDLAASRSIGRDAEILAELKEIKNLLKQLLESSGVNDEPT